MREPSLRPSLKRDLATLLTAAWLIRVAAALVFPNIYHPDEIHQSIEQAYRLVTGYGLTGWEFQYGARPLLLTYCLTPVVWGSMAFHWTRTHLHESVAMAVSVVSLAPVAAGYIWGRRAFGRAGGWMVGGFCAVWFQLVYFAPKALSETFGGSALIAGLVLLYPRSAAPGWKTKIAGGILLGLAAAFRYQFSLTVGVALIALCRREWRSWWAPVAAGVTLGVSAGLLADVIGWGYPFSQLRNYQANAALGYATYFGAAAWHYYPLRHLTAHNGAIVPILVCALFGAKRYPLLLGLAVSVLAVHQAVPHKEYRFLLPALMIEAVLVGTGSAVLIDRFRGAWSWGKATALVLSLWAFTSVTVAFTRANIHQWFLLRGPVLAFREITADPAACGIAMPEGQWPAYPGMSGMLRPVPLYEFPSAPQQDFSRAVEYNYLVSETDKPPGDPFRFWKHFGASGFFRQPPQVYVYRRPGVCAAGKAPLVYPEAPPALRQLWGPPPFVR